jgi:pyruvate dehydrogenase E2 component (dihydrolipoamide acetyltransferase)
VTETRAEATVDVVMPQMGVSVAEGTVTIWLKRPGDAVEADEALLEISTDKVDTEVPSPASGVLVAIHVPEGETAEVGAVLATISTSGELTAAPAAPAPPIAEALPVVVPDAPRPTAPAGSRSREPQANPGPAFISPRVAGLAASHGIDVRLVHGTGAGGRVTKRDMLDHIRTVRGTTANDQPRSQAPAIAADAPVSAAGAALSADETLQPLSGMRKEIASRMRHSLDTVAHVTSVIEVDMTNVVAARARLKRELQSTGGAAPTYLAYVAQAVIETLGQYPWINGEIRGDAVVTRDFVNLGIAVELAGGTGLIVPSIKHAERLNVLGLASAISDIAERARTKKLTADDVQGATFTITNPGGYGTSHGTPIVNHPQVAILGMYSLVKRPRIVEDELGHDVIAIRSAMNVSLSYDHRLIDGALAGRFLRDLRLRLEAWDESRGA